VLLDSWNKMTSLWLRYVVYERCRSTFAVFLFSAFWHGFYPGYYLTFLGGAICIHAGRLASRHCSYDNLTCTNILVIRLYNCYFIY